MSQHYSLLIIGGGPIGLACALAAKHAGIDYMILEKGCLTNSLYNYPMNMTFFSTSERLEIGGIPFVSNNVKPTRPEALEYYRRVTLSNELNIHLQEEVLEVVREGHHYRIKSSRNTYTATCLIVATGFYDIPIYLGVPGEELPKVVHYYKEAHFYALQKVIVVGASNSSVDAALETWRKGADVTMVVRKDKIGDRVKYWVKPDMENRIKEGSIKVYFNSQVREIREREVDIETPYGIETIANDYVIALTGYQPNFDFLRRIGVQLSDDALLQPSYNPDTMETNLPDVYLAGVVVGGMNTHLWFIENSRIHAEKIIQAIVAKRS